VIDAKLRYPNTALLYIEFDSSQFNGSIPQISCEPRGRVIRVPDTYDPETRTYSGTWTGRLSGRGRITLRGFFTIWCF
jgi:predicted phage tail protein